MLDLKYQQGAGSSSAIDEEVKSANAENREVELSTAQLVSLGHTKKPLLRVIREHCLSCVGGNRAEVKRCTAVRCGFWVYRSGSNPHHKRKSSGSEHRFGSRVQPKRAAETPNPTLTTSEGSAE
jgi:hypothetical protein